VTESFEPLSNLDATLLGIEDKTNLMVVAGIFTFARPVDVAALKEIMQQRWLTQRRLRQRLVRPALPLARAYWEEDPYFKLNAHVHRVALPAPGDDATLRELVSDLVSMPLDYSKPLWHIHIIENYGAGGAILLRIHHALADGVALTSVLESFTATTAVASLPAMNGSEATAVLPPTNHANNPPELAKQVTFAAQMGRRFLRRLAITGLDVISTPEKGRELVDQGVAYTQSAFQLALKVAEPETLFNKSLGVRKQVAWTTPIPLAEIRRLRQQLGGTVNDVLITALIGGLRRYMLLEGEPINGARLRLAIPVNLRQTKKVKNLGNEFGLVFLTAPLAMADPQERLAEVRAGMAQLKQSSDAMTVYHLGNVLSFAPPAVQNALIKQMGTLATAVVSNVVGLPETRYLAGQQIKEMIFLAPQTGSVGLGITIHSYAGQVNVGFSADPKLINNPDALMAAFHEEYAAMVSLAG
jgi:diacylglycerol O-acyltransferase / wax synthase